MLIFWYISASPTFIVSQEVTESDFRLKDPEAYDQKSVHWVSDDLMMWAEPLCHLFVTIPLLLCVDFLKTVFIKKDYFLCGDLFNFIFFFSI